MVGSLPGMRGTNSSILKAWVALVSKRQKIKVASSTWKAIEATKNLIKKGAFFLLRDGKSINVWTDPWMPQIEGFKPQPKVEEYTQLPIEVYQLFDPSSKTWNANMVNEIFTPIATHAILTIPNHVAPRQYRLIWLLDSKGIFSIKYVHRVSFTRSNSDDQPQAHWKKLSKARFPEHLKMLTQRISANAIPTRANLQRRLQNVDPICILCNSGEETSIHLFFECHFARALWASACQGLRIAECRYHILYSLRLGPLFSNDSKILKPKVGLGLDQIEIDLRKVFYEKYNYFMS